MGLTDYLLEKVRGRKKDINLPNELPITPERIRVFNKERSDSSIKSLQNMGEKVKGLFPEKTPDKKKK